MDHFFILEKVVNFNLPIASTIISSVRQRISYHVRIISP